jgi:hypothetical protein
MLFRKEILEGIRAGAITVAFRRWRRPTVRTGGTLLTPVGQIAIASVESVTLVEITADDARQAGYPTRAALVDELEAFREGDLFRIRLGPLRPDPRIALRATPVITSEELRSLKNRLRRLDARASGGPWTTLVLETIRSHPATRAGDLCRLAGQDKEQFKLNVRKLKNLGLTESLGTGYRLSPRGEALLALLQNHGK